MSLELVDLRAKVPTEHDDVIEAYAQANGVEKADVLREIIASWAARQVHFATVLQQRAARRGKSGKAGE